MTTATLSVTELKTLRQHLRSFEFADVMNIAGLEPCQGQPDGHGWRRHVHPENHRPAGRRAGD